MLAFCICSILQFYYSYIVATLRSRLNLAPTTTADGDVSAIHDQPTIRPSTATPASATTTAASIMNSILVRLGIGQRGTHSNNNTSYEYVNTQEEEEQIGGGGEGVRIMMTGDDDTRYMNKSSSGSGGGVVNPLHTTPLTLQPESP